MLTINRDDGYTISTDPARIDVDRVHHWLATDAYWALGRSREAVVRSIAGSLPFGVYRPGDDAQVGFARAVTDSATFCWIGDVYVDRAERGRGLGRWLATTVRDEVARRGVRRFLLATADAHGLYAALGFRPLAKPDRYLELDQRVTGPAPVAEAERPTSVTGTTRPAG